MDGQTSLLVTLIIGGIAGWLAGLIMRGSGYGLVGDVVVGLLGALLGTYLLGHFRIAVRHRHPRGRRRDAGVFLLSEPSERY